MPLFNDFRSRPPVQNNEKPEYPSIAVGDGIIGLVGHKLSSYRQSRRDPIAVSDEMTTLLSAAIRRIPVGEVMDSFGIYRVLLPASHEVLRDIYNRLLADESHSPIEDPDLKMVAESRTRGSVDSYRE